MATTTRTMQDRRSLSRLPARLACTYAVSGVARKGMIVDLSLTGARLSSDFLPPKGSGVTISFELPDGKSPVAIDGTVIRGGWGMSDHGEVCTFGIRFNRMAPEVHALIRSLGAKG